SEVDVRRIDRDRAENLEARPLRNLPCLLRSLDEEPPRFARIVHLQPELARAASFGAHPSAQAERLIAQRNRVEILQHRSHSGKRGPGGRVGIELRGGRSLMWILRGKP